MACFGTDSDMLTNTQICKKNADGPLLLPFALKSALKFPPYPVHLIALAGLYVDRAE